MIISNSRATLELVSSLIVAALVGVIAHGYVFVGLADDLLLSAVTAVVGLLVVSGLFSLRRTALMRRAVRRRYNLRLTSNEMGFLLRSGRGGHGVVTNAANPAGLWLKSLPETGWELRTAQGEPLTRTDTQRS